MPICCHSRIVWYKHLYSTVQVGPAVQIKHKPNFLENLPVPSMYPESTVHLYLKTPYYRALKPPSTTLYNVVHPFQLCDPEQEKFETFWQRCRLRTPQRRNRPTTNTTSTTNSLLKRGRTKRTKMTRGLGGRGGRSGTSAGGRSPLSWTMRTTSCWKTIKSP